VTARPARFSRENALLFAACRLGPRAEGVAPAEPLDWEYLLQAADRQGVAPLLHDWLMRHHGFAAPASFAERLYHAYWANHFRNRLLLSELALLADAAAGAGIDVMPLKGAILALDYYPTPALRPMSDLDLLVRVEDLEGMGRLLGTLGYREIDPPASYVEDRRLDRASREHQWVTARNGLSVLVEYRAEPLGPAVARLADLDNDFTATLRRHAAAMWSRARPASDQASVGLRMSPEDLLLHVAIHLAAHHADFRLIWLHDVARITARRSEGFDWEYVCASATRLRVAGPVRAALQAAAQWIDAPVRVADLERLLDSPSRRSMVSIQRWEYRRLSEHVANLGNADLTAGGPCVRLLGAAFARLHGWGPCLRVLRWAVLPSREFLALWHDRAAATGRIGYATTCARRYASALARVIVSAGRLLRLPSGRRPHGLTGDLDRRTRGSGWTE
jgi:putative nucleotidyltransferase-like protein